MPHPFYSHPAVFGESGYIIAALPITGTATITNADEVIPVDATSGGFTLTLPAARNRRSRELYIVKTQAANTVTISRAGADVIGFAGVTTVALTAQDGVVHLISDGVTRWIRLQ